MPIWSRIRALNLTSVYCPLSTNLGPQFVGELQSTTQLQEISRKPHRPSVLSPTSCRKLAETEEEAAVVLAAARLPWVSLARAAVPEALAEVVLLRDLRVAGRHS